MKKLLNNLFTPLSKRELNDLTTEIKETIAFDLTAGRQKVFTSADLWNIHRSGRVRHSRRFL
ncbi:MAG: hypothetical protein QM791_19130 [Ferruginibacter sp.]